MTLTAAAEMCVTDINYCITLIKNSLHWMPKFAASVNVSRVHPVHCLVIIPISLLPSAEKTGNSMSEQPQGQHGPLIVMMC